MRSALYDRTEAQQKAKFDFSYDYEVINLLGETLFDVGKQQLRQRQDAAARVMFNQAIEAFQRTLEIDPENVTAHYNMQLLYAQLGDAEKSQRHRELHLRCLQHLAVRPGAGCCVRREPH